MQPWIKIERIPGPLAGSYEKACRLVIKSYYSSLAEEILSNSVEGLILDLGTGPGYLPIEIVKRHPSIRAVGVDLSRSLIHMAQASAAKAGLSDRVDFKVGNAARLKFQDAFFDMVISTGMLHSLRQPVEVLREIYRVLKMGGEAWIYDPAKIASSIDVKKWKDLLSSRDRFFLRLFTRFKLFSPSIKPFNRDQVITMIEATDFKEYRIDKNGDEMHIKLKR